MGPTAIALLTTRGRSRLQRFEDKIQPEPNSGCWLWLAAHSTRGYPQFYIPASFGSKKETRGNRCAWILFRGPIPEGKIVCHSCDNPSCVNPSHLFIGTSKENTHDCIQKGRAANWPSYNRGFKNPRTRISREDLAEMKAMAARGVTQEEIGKCFGLSQSRVSDWLRGLAHE